MGKIRHNEDDQHVSTKYRNFQEFLDNEQYSMKSILSYERIFGKGFISVGGFKSTEEITKRLNLKPGDKVLDVGCGIGGGDFYLAEKFGASCYGVDLSENVIKIAQNKLKDVDVKNVEFDVADITTINIPDESYDVIYSRDTILHIKEKQDLFNKFFKWLKPGGKLLITDYCCTEDEWTSEFTNYVKNRGYFLLTLKEYENHIQNSGFERVEAINNNKMFLECLRKELNIIEEMRTENLDELWNEELYEYRKQGWNAKIKRAEDGMHIWGLIFAQKPQK